MTELAHDAMQAADEIEIDPGEVDQIIAATGGRPEDLISILRAFQERYSYLPEAALRRLCETTGISPATVTGVATFYHQFRMKPAGRHTIRVCIGTACHVKGASGVFDAFKQYLGISEDEDTDVDRLFTVEKVACLGCCMLAPAVQIDDLTYGHLSPQKVPRVLRDFLASFRQTAEARAGRAAPAGAQVAGEIRMCLCSSCVAAGARGVYDEFRRQIAAAGISATLKVVGCTGISWQAPLVEVALPDGRIFRYGRLAPQDVRAVLLRHFRPTSAARRAGAAAFGLLERLLTDQAWEPVTRYAVDVRDDSAHQYHTRQKQIATEHAGHMDPLDLDDYIRHAGFEALKRCRDGLSPETLIDEITRSGLRGRGGAGFSTGAKWAAVRAAAGDTKYIISNGDEGDPGAFMDRMILESFPLRVIEGAAIAAWAVGASKGFFYIRAEYPLAARRVRKALEICEARGIIGENAMGTGMPLHFGVAQGAGAFVCGEETALIKAIEGRRGMPRLRPPYPSQEGLWGKPTLVNNVETLALVPWILRHGPEAFAEIGTESSSGTKTFALAGKVARGGLIEVPMGTTLREIVEDIGAGVPDDQKLKAVQVGGPSGGCVPADLIDTPVDYEALSSAGAIMGSGGLVVLDETNCMVDVARYFLRFTQMESCGKCTFCRIGTKRMLEVLERLCEGDGKPGDIEELEHLAHITQEGSLCGLGRTAPNPVLSTIKAFRSEYEAHIEGYCPAKSCKALITYVITDDCIGCTRCAQRCPAEAIAVTPYRKHEIDPEKCTRCDTCRQVCPSDAVIIESGPRAGPPDTKRGTDTPTLLNIPTGKGH
ncbi:MAG: NAD(P)H-dependent oxidoreductase subunit E [Planctomycetes bacterium]|nr:NAD(P)H-dependent oxidoreductase subunit E [Planctomycetota bacterium]